jgi:alpha/beta superfamily hydrolase
MPTSAEKEFRLKVSETKALVADLESRVAVIVAHPWGPLGGNLHNPLVVAAVLYFQRLGITTVRFDFCGSGISRGYREVQQVQEVADSLLKGDFSKNKTLAPTHILLAGYSYGSLITASASASIPACVGCISIAPPFGVQHWLLMFNSDYHIEQATKRQSLPRLCIIGDNDNFTSESLFSDIVETRFPAETTTGAVVKGADHFFARREKDVMDVIGEWLLCTFPQCRGDLRKLRKLGFGLVADAEQSGGN